MTSPDLQEYVRQSTKKSGVPLKVRDAATINRLALLVSSAKRSQPSKGRSSSRATSGGRAAQGGLSPSHNQLNHAVLPFYGRALPQIAQTPHPAPESPGS